MDTSSQPSLVDVHYSVTQHICTEHQLCARLSARLYGKSGKQDHASMVELTTEWKRETS